VSLRELLNLETKTIAIGLKPRNIHQISLNLVDQSSKPISGADIKISNVQITEDMEDEE
jgi:glutamate formiminotransferase